LNNYSRYEDFSVAAGLGVVILDASGRTVFESSVHRDLLQYLDLLYAALDCAEACRVASLYGIYQTRRFGGRYVFYAPSGLVYCASPLAADGAFNGALAGPFILTDREDFIYYDVVSFRALPEETIAALVEGVKDIPCRSPRRARAVGELLFYITNGSDTGTVGSGPAIGQAGVITAPYAAGYADALLNAVEGGDLRAAEAALNAMLKDMLFKCGGDLEALRSRVVELTVLLSRAALAGGADIRPIFGMNYNYLREIDGFNSVEDIVMWLQTAARTFTRQVFDYSGAKHADVIYRAVDFIKRNYAAKITIDDVANHLFLSGSYFSRIFKEETGQTPGAYITNVCVEESKKLLKKRGVELADVPEAVGFVSQSYFTKVFRKAVGCTPGAYRRRNL